MTFSALWTNPSSVTNRLVGWVARLPARVQTKLLVAFLSIVGLLIVLGAVGMHVLSGVNDQTNELIKLQRRIAAYHQFQHDTTNQLYSISTALLLQDDRMLDAALRQLGQFGYDLDRMEFVASEQVELLDRVRQAYEGFTGEVTNVVELIRAGKTEEARKVQLAQIVPLADRLERLTNQLVNIAEADMVVAIEKAEGAYGTSRWIVISFAAGSILLALGLGYIISWSLIEPVTKIEVRLRQMAAGEFAQHVDVVNRDELGVLAENVNHTSEQLGRLYREIEDRTGELRTALRQQTATAQVLQVISRSTFDLQTVLDTLVKSAASLCNASQAAILIRDGDQFHAGALLGTGPEQIAALETRAIDRKSISGRVVLSGQVEHIPDILADTEYDDCALSEHRSGIRSLMAAPLLRGEKVEGVFFVARPEPGSLGRQQSELVQTLADQAVIAIGNVRMFEEIQARNRELTEALEQQTATGSILRTIAASPTDIQPVLDAVAESAAKLCDAYDAAILLKEGDALALKAHYGPIPIDFVKWPIGRDWVSGRAFVDRKPIQVDDLAAAGDEFPAGRDMALRLGHRTILAVPLLREGGAIGTLIIRRVEVRPFTTKQIELLTTFADQAVIAIENVRLFQEVQARTGELARSVGELEALGEVSQAVNSTLDLDTVLKTIVAKAVQLSNADAGTIYVFSNTRQQFRLRASYGMSDELISAISNQQIGVNDPGLGDAARLRAPVQFSDLGEAARSPAQKVILQAGYRSVLVVPLLRPNKIVGGLVVRRRTPGDFEEQVVDLLQTFAAQSVVAIQNARLFSEIEEKSRQLEVASRHKSQFLANMSHELRTPLNSVLGFAELLVDGIYGELPDKAKATVSRVQANGRHLLGLINDVLDLSKIEAGQLTLVLDDYSVGQIVRAVEAAVEPLARAKGLELTTIIADDLAVGRGDERRLTQVLLNLAGNAVKFTETGSVEICADAIGSQFEIVVRDTGPGIAQADQVLIFDEFQQVDNSSTRQKGGTGLGLAISKRIVELHGGALSVESETGSGSTFRMTIPIRAEERMKAA